MKLEALFRTKGVDPIYVAPVSIAAAAVPCWLLANPGALILPFGILPSLLVFALVSTQRRAT